MLKVIYKRFLTLALLAGIATAGTASAATLINGAGASFPHPLYSKWFSEYAKVDKGVQINYQSIGSGGGIKQIMAETIDFGASDKFLSDKELAKAPGKLLHIPTVMGAVVVTYNLPGLDKGVKLTAGNLADIFLGKITMWNDPRLVSNNTGLKAVNQPIIVVHRSDGSGTSAIFTDYLSSVSSEWKESVGMGSSVNWPVGLGGKGNEGVAGQVKGTKYTIGYVELAYAVENRLAFADLQNQAGKFVVPSIKSTSAAAAGAAKSMPADFRLSLVNQPGNDAYPIVGFTWLLVYQEMKDQAKARKLVEFLQWELKEGQQMAEPMLYAPLPANVARMVEATIKTIKY